MRGGSFHLFRPFTFLLLKTTGIFGGSFNPIHNGHIALARQLLRLASLDEIWFMVSPLNPFKRDAGDLLDDGRRLLMARKALQGEPRLVACDYEFRLPKPSYTWDTLRHLSADCPDRAFTLLIGADNWLAFDRWRHGSDILARWPVVVYPREGCPVDAASLPPGVTLARTRLYNVSSTEIRHRVAEGQNVAGLVPDSILPLVKDYYASPTPSPQNERTPEE